MTSDTTADSLLAHADTLFQMNNLVDALEIYQATYEHARTEFNRSVEVEALSQIARLHLKMQKKEKGREFLVMAKERASESDAMGWSRYLGVRGRYEWLEEDLPSAYATFTAMYQFCESNKLWGRAVDAANMLAIVSETPAEQIEWSKKGIDAAEATDNEQLLGPLWNNLAGTYYDMKDFENALECYINSREYHWRFSGETGKLFADYHIGMTYRLLGRYEQASQWLRPVLAWAERLGNASAVGQAAEDLGEIALVKGDKTKALEYFEMAKSAYKKAGFDETWAEVWDNINCRIEAASL